MAPPPNYVDLNRRFAVVPLEAAKEDSALQSYAISSHWLWTHNALTWDDLLIHRLVILLGEPGSGKTYELQHQATLSTPGCSRFYLRLDELATDGQHFRLNNEDAHQLLEWQHSTERAVFLLDSVDEAKIRKPADFYRALDYFFRLVGRRPLNRATIVISSRITEWLPSVDNYEIRELFPPLSTDAPKPQRAAKEDAYPLVVQLLPLDERAVNTYAKARGVAEVQDFLESLEKAHAWEFARRPADVNDLLAYWLKTGGFGTLTQILAFVCESQLRKTSDRERSEKLSLERARSGAECLAAATILCRKFIFQIPGETILSDQTIDALACLPPDWRNEEVRALLDHALFDGASYGHIRFHHRRLSEYLAARWFEILMLQGCSVGELEDLLFEGQASESVLRTSFAPLAAWLCAGAGRWNTTICRRVIEVAPEILLRYGDPAALAVTDRRALLKALSKKARGRERLWWERDQATLSRLADEALAPEICELLTAPSSGQSLLELGLEIVKAGRLKDCASAVLAVAIEDLNEGKLFPTAARALDGAGGESDLRALAAAAKSIERFPERVCVPLCTLLFPRIWSVSELFRALKGNSAFEHGGLGWDYTLSEHLASVTNKENGLALLEGLLSRSVGERDDEDNLDAPFSVRTALKVSSIMLGWSSISEEEASTIAEVLVRISSRRSFVSHEDSIAEQTQKHPTVREKYFRLAAERVEEEHGSPNASISSVVIFHTLLKPIPSDLSWITNWIIAATSDHERQRALQWGLDVWHQTGCANEGLAQIRDAAKPFPNLRKRLRECFHPGVVLRAKAFWYRQVRYRSLRYRLRLAWQKRLEPFLELRNAWNLWRFRNKLRSGEYVGWLFKLTVEATDFSKSRWSATDWHLLERKRGAKCAGAVRAGCRICWELYQPPLPHEKQPDEGATNGTIVGLAGIQDAWQQGGLSFGRLPFDKAVLATRYAISELNGFTFWFDDLLRAQPEAVRSVLEECISGEWEVAADCKHYHLVLNDLASESAAGNLVKQSLMERLTCSEPRNSNVLRDALCVLVAAPVPERSALASLAKLRSTAVPTSAQSYPQWMALWLQADALPAISALEARLQAASDSSEVFVTLCVNLAGSRGNHLPILPDASWLKPAALRRFIPLAFRYVRLEHDTHRASGETYSPTERDDAQSFRNGLVERLKAVDTPEAGNVLEELRVEPLLSHLSDYLQHLLEVHRGRSAPTPLWGANDVRTFATEYERKPQSDADLFKMGIRRILDLKRWVETGEDSPREEVSRHNKEAGFRRWLQRRLNEKSNGRYIVPQEWEIDGAVRPDLRLVIANAPPVSLELKIIDERPLNDLVAGLEAQLVGTYLRDHRAQYGIYVLALFNRNRRWDSFNGGPRIDSEQMLGVLRERIQKTLTERSDIAGLEVVLINFAPPIGC